MKTKDYDRMWWSSTMHMNFNFKNILYMVQKQNYIYFLLELLISQGHSTRMIQLNDCWQSNSAAPDPPGDWMHEHFFATRSLFAPCIETI
jgi:hypothetical protein